MKDERCELCGRSPLRTTVHHLVPRENGGVEGPTANLCQACHKQIHALFTNDELAAFYHTIPRLEEHPDMEKYLRFIRKQPPEKQITIHKSNRKKRK